METVDPIVLGVEILENESDCCCCCCVHDIPETIADTMKGALYYDNDDKRYLAVSLGIFSIIRIVRPGQYIISATEYIIPDKECISPSKDDPCSVFRSMAFPVSEFDCNGTPSNNSYEKGSGGKCGC